MTVIETLNSTVEFKIGGSDDDRILLYDLDGNEINYGAGSPYIALTRNVTAYGYGNTYKFLDRDDPRSSGRSGTPFLLSLSAPAFPFDVRLASINARRNGIAAAQINVIDYGGAENTLIRSLARRDTGRALRIGVLVPRTHAVFSGPSWLFLHVFEVDKWVHEGTPASSVSYVESYTLLATADVDMRDYKSVYAAAERAGYPRKPASVSNTNSMMAGMGFLIDHEEKFIISLLLLWLAQPWFQLASPQWVSLQMLLLQLFWHPQFSPHRHPLKTPRPN